MIFTRKIQESAIIDTARRKFMQGQGTSQYMLPFVSSQPTCVDKSSSQSRVMKFKTKYNYCSTYICANLARTAC